MQDKASSDSWHPMLAAYEYLAAHPQGKVYEALFLERAIKFQYPLTSLLYLKQLMILHGNLSVYFINNVNKLWLAAYGMLMAGWTFALAKRNEFPNPIAVCLALCSVGLTLLYYPVLKAMQLGQIQIVLDVLFALACLLWIQGLPLLSGIAIGCISMIKPQFILFFVWGLLRKEKAFTWGLLITALLALTFSVLLYGLRNNLEYLQVLQQLSHTGECYWPNQTVNGLLNRLVAPGCEVNFNEHAFPPYHALVYAGTILTSALLLLGALLYRSGKGRSSHIDFMLAALSFTLASPIAWEHHFGILPIMYVTLYFSLLNIQNQFMRKRTLLTLGFSYVLTASYIDVASVVSGTPWHIFDSTLFVGSIVLLALLYYLRYSAIGSPNGPSFTFARN